MTTKQLSTVIWSYGHSELDTYDIITSIEAILLEKIEKLSVKEVA
jgi:hypothetical protein